MGHDRELRIESVQRTLARLMRISSSRSTFARQADAIGATVTQPAYALLRVLLDAGPISMGELARLATMDVGMATRQVGSLVDDGLAARKPDPDDGRVTLAYLTEAGARTATALRDVRRRHLESALADWSERDLRTLDELLSRFQADTARTPFESQ